jgi:hypothetical protein
MVATPQWIEIDGSAGPLAWGTRFASDSLVPHVAALIPFPTVVGVAGGLPVLIAPPNPDTVPDALPFFFALFFADYLVQNWGAWINPGAVLVEDYNDPGEAYRLWRDAEAYGVAQTTVI